MRSRVTAAAWPALAVVLLIVAPALARAQNAPTDAPGVEPSGVTRRITMPKIDDGDGGVSGGDTHHDRLFQSLNAAFVIAAGTDVSVSMYQIGRGVARERAFGAPWQDSPVAFALTKSAMTAAFVYGVQRIHKNRPKTAFVLGVAATAFESWLAIRSARISPQP